MPLLSDVLYSDQLGFSYLPKYFLISHIKAATKRMPVCRQHFQIMFFFIHLFSIVFWLKYHWKMFSMVQWAITQLDDDVILWCIYASLWLNYLKFSGVFSSYKSTKSLYWLELWLDMMQVKTEISFVFMFCIFFIFVYHVLDHWEIKILTIDIVSDELYELNVILKLNTKI